MERCHFGGAPIVKYRDFLLWAVQKRLKPLICCLGCGLWWAEGSHKFNRICLVAPMCPHGRAHWRHRVNMIEPSICCGDATLSQITLTTCYYLCQVNFVYPYCRGIIFQGYRCTSKCTFCTYVRIMVIVQCAFCWSIEFIYFVKELVRGVLQVNKLLNDNKYSTKSLHTCLKCDYTQSFKEVSVEIWSSLITTVVATRHVQCVHC